MNFIVKEKMDVLITRSIGGISFHVLHGHLVDVYKSKGKTINEVIDNFIKGKLERLSEPTKELSEISEVQKLKPKPKREKYGEEKEKLEGKVVEVKMVGIIKLNGVKKCQMVEVEEVASL